MSNGNFERLGQSIQDKLVKEGIDGITDKELLIMLVVKVDNLRRPPWKTWTIREMATAFGVAAAMLNLGNVEKLAEFLSSIASAAGAK